MQKVALPSEPVVSGPARTGTTPSKLRPSSTEKRSSSAPKNISVDSLLRVQTPIELLRRSTSSRRVRRWENANLFGLDMHRDSAFESMEDVTSDGKILRSKYSAFNAESKTQFQAILESKDSDLIDSFRKGDDPTINFKSRQSQSSGNGYDELSIAEKYEVLTEKGLLKMDRNIRPVIMKKVAFNLSMIEFVYQLEALLRSSMMNDSESAEISCESSMDRSYWDQLLESMNLVDEKSGKVCLQFKSSVTNSSFLRLMTHGVCQFHGLSSRSVSSSTKSLSKIVQIKNPKTVPKTILFGISLGAYLLSAFVNRLRDSEVSPVNVSSYLPWEIDCTIFRDLTSSIRSKVALVDDLSTDFVLVDIHDFGVVDIM